MSSHTSLTVVSLAQKLPWQVTMARLSPDISTYVGDNQKVQYWHIVCAHLCISRNINIDCVEDEEILIT